MSGLVALGTSACDDDLLAVLRESFDACLQAHIPPDARLQRGLHAVLTAAFPLLSAGGEAILSYESYAFEAPEFSVDESLRRGMTFAAPLRLVVRLTLCDPTKHTGRSPTGRDVLADAQERALVESLRAAPTDLAFRAVYADWLEERGHVADAAHVMHHGVALHGLHVLATKEEAAYFGEVPLMTEDGTFIVNGEPRILVPRETAMWLPGDGATEARPRLVLPGERFTHAIAGAVAKLAARAVKRLSARHLDTLQPHDLLDPGGLSSALWSLFGKRDSSVALGAHNPLVTVERLRAIGESLGTRAGTMAKTAPRQLPIAGATGAKSPSVIVDHGSQ